MEQNTQQEGTGMYRNIDEAVQVLNAAGIPAYPYHSGGGVMLATAHLDDRPQVVDGRETIYDGPFVWIHDASEQGRTEGRWSLGFYTGGDENWDGTESGMLHDLTDRQLVGIVETMRYYFAGGIGHEVGDPSCDGLVSVGHDDLGYCGELSPGDVAVRFNYGRAPGDDAEIPGLEITIWDEDGDVLGSQDFG